MGQSVACLDSQSGASLRQFVADAAALFPGRFRNAVLFGSRARGDALDDSDWDVALFIDGFDESREGDDLGFLAGRYWLRGMMVSPVGLPADRRDVAAGLLANIDRDGIAG